MIMEQQPEGKNCWEKLGQLKSMTKNLIHGTVETWKHLQFTQEDISAPPHIL